MYISVVGIENLYINGFEIVHENKRLVSGFLAAKLHNCVGRPEDF